jgi:uncharacterized protein (DUF1684 family)
MYAKVRADSDPERAWKEFRKARDDMFRSHPQTPLSREDRARFTALGYFPYDPAWRPKVPLTAVHGTAEQPAIEVELAEGKLRFRTFGTVALRESVLAVYWIEGYGGGLFLPFKDATSGAGTFGGGRYLYDTIKGADLGAGPESIVLDFNFAYNPSCAYSAEWVCPLAPSENTLPFAVEAGERAFTLAAASSPLTPPAL